MNDPTYDRTEIAANPEWDLAFVLSECLNDGAPLGWSKYIWIARELRAHFAIQRKPAVPPGETSGE